MAKIIVNAPTGIQEIIEVGEGGGYFDDMLVVWDERIDGELLPADLAKVGGLKKDIDGKLIVDAARKKTTDDALKAKKDLSDKKAADKAARKLIFKNLDGIQTVADVKLFLKALLAELDLEIE